MNKTELQTKVIEMIKEKMQPLSETGKQEVIKEINHYLQENSIGILIVSNFNKKGETDLKLDVIRTHEKHIKETFIELFKRQPQIKNIIYQIYEEEHRETEKNNYKKMVS